MKKVFLLLQQLIDYGTAKKLQVYEAEELQLQLPLLLFLLFVCLGFWLLVPILGIGLFCGFRYAVNEFDWLNAHLEKLTAGALYCKDWVKQFIQSHFQAPPSTTAYI